LGNEMGSIFYSDYDITVSCISVTLEK
jgi:hypothetical protein